MTDTITQAELENYLWGAAIILRGRIDSSDYREYIFPLLFFKRISDVYDEEYEQEIKEYGQSFPENHRLQIPDGAHWSDVRKATKDVGTAIQNAMRAIENANPEQLAGIFGSAKWTNKERLSDADLRDLIEHFSSQSLTLSRVPQDELGQGYEALIKWFADDAGHTAAEFYTNRTLVKLMTAILDPHEGESILDPTVGSGGMLLIAALQLTENGKNYRTLKLYGQDINHITTSIARMNLFLHGIEDFKIVRDDTFRHPAFLEDDRLKTFDIVLANPPYSIKQWNRKAFGKDPYGRNILGVPPQGRADYAFFQHIIKSLDSVTGRCAILFPHGVLFREDEQMMREKLVKMDIVECVLGLGPNLFYGAQMEACVIICRMEKPADRKGKILFIDAVNEVRRDKTQSFIDPEHREKILAAYQGFKDIEGFARVVAKEKILANGSSLKIGNYIENTKSEAPQKPLRDITGEWRASSIALDSAFQDLIIYMKEAGLHE
jgi:type I restriction enzyme M protein